MFSVLLYLLAFVFSGCMIFYTIEKRYDVKQVSYGFDRGITDNIKKLCRLLTKALLCCAPIILLYGLRINVGTDYAAYEQAYNILHKSDLSVYWNMHDKGVGAYYVEPGYYLLNRIAPNYRVLLFLDIILILIPLWIALFKMCGHISLPMAIYIFMATQFIYSMNGVRYAIAISFLLLGFVYLSYNRKWKFLACVLLAAAFHTSAYLGFVFFLIKTFKDRKFNFIRNIIFYIFLIIFPVISKYILLFVSKLPMFYRYFASYLISKSMQKSILWVMHIIPVIIPLLLACGRKMLKDKKCSFLFRIFVAEIVFRMLGLYNTWFTRLARIPQVIEVVFIPYVLYRIENKNNKKILTLYYIVWYTFYFIYYIYVNDNGGSIPYRWVFGEFIHIWIRKN